MLQKRIITLSIFAIITFVVSMNTFDIQANNKESTSSSTVIEEELIAFQQSLKELSIEELQSLLDSYSKSPRIIHSIIRLKSAWLVAAQMARVSGYPLSATLVEHSVLHKDYTEHNGIFSDQIRRTTLFNDMVDNRFGQAAFLRNLSPDLYFSIHKFEYYSSYSSQGFRLRIYDTFDFEWIQESSLFVNIVNNWAYLNQIAWVLHPIDIEVNIDV